MISAVRRVVHVLLLVIGGAAALAQSPLPYGWGYNANGQLGVGNSTTSKVPVAVTTSGNLAGKTLQSVAVGGYFSVGLTGNGTLYAWGDNSSGQLGTGSLNASLLPVPVVTISGKTIAAVAAGATHCLALTTDGLVYAWGDNSSGQLGIANLTNQSVPTAVNVSAGFSGLAGKTVIAIAAGAFHSLALASDGTVCAWGSNSNGELGINSTVTTKNLPVAVNMTAGTSALAGKTVTAIAAGGGQSVALTSDGLLVAWGLNFYGQLGNNSTTNAIVPVAVNVAAGTSALAGKTVTAIAAGNRHTLALASDGTVYAWGFNTNGELGNNGSTASQVPAAVNVTAGTSALAGKTVTAIAAGGGHSVALTTEGRVYTWGSGSAGQLGNNALVLSRVPVAVNTAAGTSPLSGRSVTVLAKGSQALHAMVIAVIAPAVTSVTVPAAGTYTAGAYTFSVTLTFESAITVTGVPRLTLAFGADTRYADFTAGSGTSSLTFSYVSQAGDSANVITVSPTIDLNGGALVGVGAAPANLTFTAPNTSSVHVLGLSAPAFTNSPVSSSLHTSAFASVSVSASGNPAPAFAVSSGSLPPGLALSSAGVISGTPSSAGSYSGEITASNSGGSVVQAFSFTIIATATVPQLYDWGADSYGQLGNNATATSLAPVAVVTSGVLAGKAITAYAVGNRHSLALASNGTLYAWGQNSFGQRGDNSSSFDSAVPLAVNTSGTSAFAGRKVTAIAAGSLHSVALDETGRVYTWGHNQFGQLGTGQTFTSGLPVLTGLSNATPIVPIVAIAAGDSHTLALDANGIVYAWGNNTNGQVGIGSFATSIPNATPVTLPKLIVAIAAGANHSLAVAADGTVYTWGSNNFGQLGNNSTTDSRVPVAVANTGASALTGKTVVAITAGTYHSAALASDGTVSAWGYNANGQLGNNSIVNSTGPVAVNVAAGVSTLAGKSVTAISAGQYHTVALASDGTVSSWGDNAFGQLGTGAAGNSSVPVAVKADDALFGQVVIALGAGGTANHTLVYARPVSSAATIVKTGAPLGANLVAGASTVSLTLTYDSIVTVTSTPRLALTVGGTTRYAIYAGGSGSSKLTFSYATVVGDSGNGITVASPIDLNGGSITGANLTAASLAFTPQNLSAINIQTGTVPVFTSNPVPATGITGTAFSTLLTASGYPPPTFSLASGTLPPGLTLRTTGALFGTPTTVGTYAGTFAATNSQGSATQAFNIVVTAPVAVLFTSTPLDRSLRVGVVNTYTLVASGSPAPTFSVQSGGLPPGLTLNAAGNLSGTPTTTGDYTGVFAATNSVNTATQNFHFAVTAATTLPQAFAWGADVNGQIGNNTTISGGVHVPVAVTMSGALAGREIIALAVGSEHTLALASDGTVYAWGSNLHGQLGDGTATNRSVPVAVNRTAGTSALAGRTVIAIAAAGYNSMALASDGTVYTWGDNTYGQLGNSTMGGASYVPVAVNLVPGYSALAGKTVTGIATAGTSFVALASDGTVCTWGRNNFGQLGNNSTADTLVPVAVNVAGGVSALAGKTVTAVAAGAGHVLVLASDGMVYAWGDNSLAQLGNSSVATTSLVPVAVNTAAGVSNLAGKTITAISAGTYHGLALASDGSVSAWGYNSDGQLGNGATGLSAVPVAVNVTSGVSALAGKTVTQIVGSGYHSLALASDGSVCAWGSGSSGELGDNGSTDQLVPVAVNTVSGVSALAGQSVVALAVGSESAHCVVLAKPAPATVPVFTNTALTTSLVTGSAASFALTASGTPAAVFTIQSGALPTGLTLNFTSGLVTGTPTSTGTFTGVFAATNTAGSATQSFSFTVTAPVFDFTAFRNLNFTPAELADATISGPLADPDHDGVPNLLEFALGSDPRNSNLPGWTLVQEGTNWVYRYTRPAGGAVGVTYIVESSNDLVTWTTVTSVIESTSAGVDTMKATVPTNGTSNFFRLSVTQP